MPLISQPQRKGEAYILSFSLLEAFFPIFAFFTATALGGLHAYFYSLAIAVVFLVAWFLIRGRLPELKRTEAYKDLAFTSLYITTLFCLLFLALTYTSPSNVAVIIFLQVLFSYLFLGRKQGERLDKTHLLGVVLMSVGALIVLFPENYRFNIGDLLALLAAMLGPTANLYQKRARQYVSSETILTIRSLIALPFIYGFAVVFEPSPLWENIESQLVWLFLTGFLIFFLAKILWVEALNLLPITKVNAMFAFSPLVTIALAYWILNDIPTWTQILGALPILIGSYFITRPSQPS